MKRSRSGKEEQRELLAEQKRLYDERAKLKKKMQELDIVKDNVDKILSVKDDKIQECGRLYNELA